MASTTSPRRSRTTRLTGLFAAAALVTFGCASEPSYDLSDALTAAAALDGYRLAVDVSGEEMGQEMRVEMRCDVFVAAGTSCDISLDDSVETVDLRVVYAEGADEAFVGGELVEELLGLLDAEGSWISEPLDGLDVGFATGPLGIGIDALAGLNGLPQFETSDVERGGETVRSYGFLLEPGQVRDLLAVPQEDPDAEVVIGGLTRLDVFVSRDSALRGLAYTVNVDGADVSYDMSLSPLADGAVFEVPAASEVADLDGFGGFADDVRTDRADEATLREYSAACALGDMAACDTLYWESPIDSDDEQFGATCGGTHDESNAGGCELMSDGFAPGDGFTPADEETLAEYRAACADGDMAACDTLYWESPIDSDDEAFGATCGGTRDESNAGGCDSFL